MSLWQCMPAALGDFPGGTLHGTATQIDLQELRQASSLGGRLEELRGRSVLVATQDQLTAALALIELDGIARRMVLCPPDLAEAHRPYVIATSAADAAVVDADRAASEAPGIVRSIAIEPRLELARVDRSVSHETEWILLTSGTTGAPKLVLHTLASLTSARSNPAPAAGIVWSTFYDIRRYGGLQILLRALRQGSMVLSSPAESVVDFLARAARAAVTHISGTASHWRRALMSGAAERISPRYVRLSGEIADQPILDALHAAYPRAIVAHAFASTEAGVAFEVEDGLAGFPAHLIGTHEGIELQIVAETLRIRSLGNARCYLGNETPLKGEDGFVNTGDRLEPRAGRYHFMGRSGGIINVGGLKVHPEEVEAVINAHPWVRMSLVKSRRNPITGAVVTADVVLAETAAAQSGRPPDEAITHDIIERCRRALASHKVPAMVRIVPALEVSASGKLVRPNA
jgi:acyl-coenzyme A synthetase/AMP-(fatty) acid ligase